ncbi:DUF4331 family protein [Meridianimarinicoccus sp. RP-17]|uniref:DUF4331 family protein n=1 Tax=Meridianimarinicoccus zhengii TaxID=2056810 RepID=UPI0013A697BD|nr:DUF4331 family protein [Phycocomes zhengii]
MAAGLVAAGCAAASDHKDSPATRANPAADIGDIFIFEGPQTGGLAMVMTVNPLSGAPDEDSPPSDSIKLDPTLVYQFKLDTDGDARADIAYKLRAADIDGEPQKQSITLRRASGAEARANGWQGDVIAEGFTTALNAPLEVAEGKAGELLFAGVRRDPFFFDFTDVQAPTELAIRQALGAGDDLPAEPSSILAFGKTDMTVIVLEVPMIPELRQAGFWSVVANDAGTAVDRMGRTGIQGIFLVDPPPGRNPELYLPRERAKYPTIGDLNDAYNSTAPADDPALYGDQFAYRFAQLEMEEARIDERVEFYLPDILHWDADADPRGYPHQRSLREDSVFWTIANVNPFYFAPKGTVLPRYSDQPLSDRFPYVAASVHQDYQTPDSLVPVHPIYMDR